MGCGCLQFRQARPRIRRAAPGPFSGPATPAAPAPDAAEVSATDAGGATVRSVRDDAVIGLSQRCRTASAAVRRDEERSGGPPETGRPFLGGRVSKSSLISQEEPARTWHLAGLRR